MNSPHKQNADDDSVVPAGSLGEAANIALRRDDTQNKSGNVRKWFLKFSQVTAFVMGTPWAFITALIIVIAWAALGPVYKYSNTWQLVINTGTTIITFLMVFLIQNTQNRDAKAIHLKLDELIRSKKGARNLMVDLENCTDEELDSIESEFKRLRQQATQKQRDTRKKPT